MALPSLVPVSDLEIRLGLAPGTLTGADLARAEAALADVSAEVRLAAGSDLVAADGLTIVAPDAVLVVTRTAALRTYRNPDGYAGETVEGYSWQAPQGAVGVYLDADEVARVKAAIGAAGGVLGIGTIRTPSAYPTDASGTTDLASWGLL